MTDEAKRALDFLRNDSCGGCVFNSPIGVCDKGECLLMSAADLIEHLSVEQDALVLEIERLRKELEAAKSGWISVEDRLPESDGDYLVCDTNDGDYGVYGCFFDSGYAEFGSWGSDYDPYTHGSLDSKWYKEDTITHWQPMPEPPKEVFNELQCSKNESP